MLQPQAFRSINFIDSTSYLYNYYILGVPAQMCVLLKQLSVTVVRILKQLSVTVVQILKQLSVTVVLLRMIDVIVFIL